MRERSKSAIANKEQQNVWIDQTIDVLIAVDADYLIANPDALVANAVSMLVNREAIDSQATGIYGAVG
ncbi:hypothetical protein [Pseudomonas sp. LW8]|uniref:hypothetical protein n=1 Tax=Pseudomonas TaxID=286 RepID=UPI0035C03B9F